MLRGATPVRFKVTLFVADPISVHVAGILLIWILWRSTSVHLASVALRTIISLWCIMVTIEPSFYDVLPPTCSCLDQSVFHCAPDFHGIPKMRVMSGGIWIPFGQSGYWDCFYVLMHVRAIVKTLLFVIHLLMLISNWCRILSCSVPQDSSCAFYDSFVILKKIKLGTLPERSLNS